MLAAALALSMSLGTASPGAQAQINTEEEGAGAAAVSIVALRCLPTAFAAIKRDAFAYLADRLRDHPADERERVIDSAERKLRALTIASEKTDCAGMANLSLMAQIWGYANLLAAP